MMSVRELINLAGFDVGDQLTEALRKDSEVTTQGRDALLEIDDIPVGELYWEAKKALGAYSELHKHLESVRRQISTLASLNPLYIVEGLQTKHRPSSVQDGPPFAL